MNSAKIKLTKKLYFSIQKTKIPRDKFTQELKVLYAENYKALVKRKLKNA